MNRLWNWVLRWLGLGPASEELPAVGHYPIPPLSAQKQLTARFCANYEGRGFTERVGPPAPGWFWKRDKLAPVWRLYRNPVK